MQFNKPRFDWEAKDHLSELEQFKQECSVLFQGSLSEMKDAQKAGLVVNWIGRQCVMTLHSMGIELDRPKTVFDSLEKIFHPESNQTLSHFKFRGLKQKSTQSCDSYMKWTKIVHCRVLLSWDSSRWTAKRSVYFWPRDQRNTRPLARGNFGRGLIGKVFVRVKKDRVHNWTKKVAWNQSSSFLWLSSN